MASRFALLASDVESDSEHSTVESEVEEEQQQEPEEVVEKENNEKPQFKKEWSSAHSFEERFRSLLYKVDLLKDLPQMIAYLDNAEPEEFSEPVEEDLVAFRSVLSSPLAREVYERVRRISQTLQDRASVERFSRLKIARHVDCLFGDRSYARKDTASKTTWTLPALPEEQQKVRSIDRWMRDYQMHNFLQRYMREAASLIRYSRCEDDLKSVRYFADVCSAPGGFSAWMLTHNKKARGVALSIPYDEEHPRAWHMLLPAQSDRFTCILGDVTADPEHCLLDASGSRFHANDVVFCDGHITMDKQSDKVTSRDYALLHWSRLLVALNAVKQGGRLYFRMPLSLAKDELETLVLCRKSFKWARAFKPSSDVKHLLQSQAYFLFDGFRRRDYERHVKPRLVEVLGKLRSGELDHVLTTRDAASPETDSWLLIDDHEAFDLVKYFCAVSDSAWRVQTRCLVALWKLSTEVEAEQTGKPVRKEAEDENADANADVEQPEAEE
ncbi:MAG: hypothetical protein MHM6MM_001650 [Cercozoa sp. M6MM]